jgi:hypothetical protein
MTHVLVPAARVVRWFENFETRHGPTSYGVVDGVLHAHAEDGSEATAALPFDRPYDGPADPAELTASAAPLDAWGVLLVRKGGFAVARLAGDRILDSKVGQRHVQGRTKAGGQSQQRFARRRDNQAVAAYAAAADHAARILTGSLEALVTGGDAPAVEAVLSDSRLVRAAGARTSLFLPVPDPRRSVLEGAVADACSVRITVRNA